MKRIMILSFFLVFFGSCAGFSKMVVLEKNNPTPKMESVNLMIDKSPELEVAPEVFERLKSIFQKQLLIKNCRIDADSQINLKIIIKKYDDGNVFLRGISGSVLGVNIGRLASIETETTVFLKNNNGEIKKGTVTVSSSRNGWDFNHGYGGARKLEEFLATEIIKNFL